MYLKHYLDEQVCEKKMYYRKLNLKSFTSKERYFSEIFELLMVSLSKDKDTFKKDLNFITKEKYSEKSYSSQNEAVEIQRYVVKHFMRLHTYLSAGDFKVIAPGFEYYLDREETITYKSDVILEHSDGSIEGVIFESIKPQYSYQGKKFETKATNSVELNGLIRQLMKLFPKKEIKATILYLRNKDDKKDLFPDYEYKKGTNIISIKVSDIKKAFVLEDDEVLNHINMVTDQFLNMSREKDCTSCRHQKVCNFEYHKAVGITTNIRLSEVSQTIVKTSNIVTFNAEQSNVLNNFRGKCQVVAVPGAGKTRILVESIKKNIRENVNAKEILALTFTNKATAEIKERLSDLEGIEDLRITNYNTFGYSIVRSHFKELGYDYPPRLVTKYESFEIIKQALEMFRIPFRYEYMYDKTYGQMWEIFNAIEHAIEIDMSRNTTLLEIEKPEFYNFNLSNELLMFIPLLALRYQAVLKEKNLISYSQQIDLVNVLFAQNPYIVESLRKKYKYVYLDEYQDTNKQQHKMIMKFAVNNVLMVGDEDQSIFGFRGAEPMNFLSFMKDGENKFFLSTNYRSGSAIIERANSLITRNVMRNNKTIRPGTAKRGRVIEHQLIGHGQVVDIIDELVELNYKLEDIAIIARKNKHLEAFREIINSAGYKAQSNFNRLLTDGTFILFIAYLRVISLKASREDEYIVMKHVYGESRFSIDGSILRALMIHGAESYSSFNEDVRMFRNNESQIAQINFIFSLINASSSIVHDYIIELFDSLHLASLSELLQVLEGIEIIDEDVTIPAAGEGIHLLTAHASKGLEFKAVIVYDIDDFVGDEEERRLLYVAMTRAEEELHLVNIEKNKKIKEAV